MMIVTVLAIAGIFLFGAMGLVLAYALCVDAFRSKTVPKWASLLATIITMALAFTILIWAVQR